MNTNTTGNETNVHSNVLSIAVNDPENYDPGSNLQYTSPSIEYDAGPPPSIQVNRRIPIGMMNHQYIAAEFDWLRELGPDLENLGMSEAHIVAVLMALVHDIRTAHPDFVP